MTCFPFLWHESDGYVKQSLKQSSSTLQERTDCYLHENEIDFETEWVTDIPSVDNDKVTLMKE